VRSTDRRRSPQRPRPTRTPPIDAVDDATLAQARADFGQVVMTEKTLLADPFVEPGTGARFPTPELWAGRSD
jgi:hypothetical protein